MLRSFSSQSCYQNCISKAPISALTELGASEAHPPVSVACIASAGGCTQSSHGSAKGKILQLEQLINRQQRNKHRQTQANSDNLGQSQTIFGKLGQTPTIFRDHRHLCVVRTQA
jgi:hypothetical protein